MNAVRIIRTARDLRSVEGENPEYDRALVELASDLIGTDDEGRAIVEALILGGRH